MTANPSLLCARADGELYAGVYIDFMGTDSAIFRTLGQKTAMRTDQYNSRWLNGKQLTSHRRSGALIRLSP